MRHMQAEGFCFKFVMELHFSATRVLSLLQVRSTYNFISTIPRLTSIPLPTPLF
jgi:hypothetical protein